MQKRYEAAKRMARTVIAILAIILISAGSGIPVLAAPSEDLQQEKYNDDLELLACLVQAEAGNQPLRGKVLVAACILNRADSPDFPDTIREVIYQPGQFATVSDGALDKAFTTVTDSDFLAVRMALEDRTDPYILYFTAGGYGAYGTPAYRYGGHWFGYR